MSKFCSKCGKELTDDSKFCNSCGTVQDNKENVIPIQQEVNVNKKNNQDIKIPGWLALLIIIFVGLFIWLSLNGELNLFNFSKKDPQVEDRSNIEYQKITVDELEEELNNNAATAKETYKGKYLEVTGKLGTIDADLEYISLDAINKSLDFDGIHCSLNDPITKQKVKTLNSGQTIIVKGKITEVGEIMSYFMDVHEIVIP